jgi:glycosyltransferase involved in cell wall biosynthesis
MSDKMMRIGLLYPMTDPISPANWSGTPRGLAEGFAAQGIDVIPIPCRLSEMIRLPLALFRRVRRVCGTVAHREPLYVTARSMAIAAALRQVGHLDAIVAMGTDMYDLQQVIRGCSVPVATYDDGNFTLFLRYEDSDLRRSGFPIKDVKLWARRQAEACQAANVACVSTLWAKKSAVEDFGLAESKVHVVGMGHRPRYVPIEARDWTTPRFLFIGVEWGRKNGAAVVEAFARVRERFPNAKLDLVGEHPPLDLPGVTGHGFLPRENKSAQDLLDRLFVSATAFVLPSLFEPAGIAYLEAASAGLPVIATTNGGAAELLQDAAISVDPYDQEALIQAMLRVCNMDIARSMGAQALVRSADSTWQAVSGRIVDSLLKADIAHAAGQVQFEKRLI